MFIDTSGWFCLFDETDSRNSAARKLYSTTDERITHSYILSELVALGIARKRGITKILQFTEDILRDSDIKTVWVDEAITWQAMDLLKSRPDKHWSLCDAVSFVIMTAAGTTSALSTDKHFEQAGFVKLLES